MSDYRDSNVDYEYLEAVGITYKWHQPWQMGLFVEEFDGKFVWYPERGTLMVEDSFIKKLGEFTDTEDMHKAIIAYMLQ